MDKNMEAAFIVGYGLFGNLLAENLLLSVEDGSKLTR